MSTASVVKASAASLSWVSRSNASSCRSCTLARTVLMASCSVAPTCASSERTRSSSRCTTCSASTCMMERVSRCPTLSWISRAMRPRSASVASLTSRSCLSRSPRFFSSSAREVSCTSSRRRRYAASSVWKRRVRYESRRAMAQASAMRSASAASRRTNAESAGSSQHQRIARWSSRARSYTASARNAANDGHANAASA